MWLAYYVQYDLTWHHVNGTRQNSMASRFIFSKCPEMLKYRDREFKKKKHNNFQDCRMNFLPTTFLEIAVYLFCNRPFPSCLLPFFVSKRVPLQIMKMSLIFMKINLEVKLIVIRMVFHINLFSHWGREKSETVYFAKKIGSNYVKKV